MLIASAGIPTLAVLAGAGTNGRNRTVAPARCSTMHRTTAARAQRDMGSTRFVHAFAQTRWIAAVTPTMLLGCFLSATAHVGIGGLELPVPCALFSTTHRMIASAAALGTTASTRRAISHAPRQRTAVVMRQRSPAMRTQAATAPAATSGTRRTAPSAQTSLTQCKIAVRAAKATAHIQTALASAQPCMSAAHTRA